MRAIALVLLFLAACDECPAGQTHYTVHSSFGGSTHGYVCIPDPEPATTTPAPATASSASSCDRQDAGTHDVALVWSQESPPASHGVLPPDGTFTLAGATRYGPTYVRPPFVLRAVLVKSGAKLTIGAQATDTSETVPEANESFTLAFGGGTLVEACATSQGTTIATTLFPDGAGSTQPTDLDWNEGTHTLTLSIHAGTQTITLDFVT